MKLALIGDIHNKTNLLKRITEDISYEKPDFILFVGDFGRSPENVFSVFTGLAPQLFVPGNHDYPINTQLAYNIDGKLKKLGEFTIFGIGGSGPAKFGFPYEWSDDELEKSVPPTDILLCHAPPYGILDKTHSGINVGSKTILEIIRISSPKIFICGHIHESQGVTQYQNTTCINTGSIGGVFGALQITYVDFHTNQITHKTGPALSQITQWSF